VTRVALLAGGTGAAKLAVGLQAVLAPGDLTVVANTGDDVEWWGLHVSPDTDAVLFRLAGLFNDVAGFGIVDDGFTTMEQLRSLGEDAWFNLGNRDLAFHILRSDQLRRGARLSQTALDLGKRLGLANRVIPVSDDPVRTWFVTDEGAVTLQEYFVRLRAAPAARAVDYAGLRDARPSPEAVAAVRDAEVVVIGPSNPVASVWPILHLLGKHLHRGRTVAVSPTVGGRALKGPTVEMMRSLGRDPSPSGVAAEYRALAGWFVLDAVDGVQEPAIRDLGYRVLVTDTLMPDAAAAEGLARRTLEFMGRG
jgi:LPPG:FO 2-phospho-L-lactate transferase